MPSRRAMLLLPILAAACADRSPVPVPPGPIGYRHLTPLPLNVASLEITEADPPQPVGDIGGRERTRPAEAMRIMARDRIVTVGTSETAVFTPTQAQLVQGRDSLSCLLACRLEILSPLGSRLAFVEAGSRRAVAGPEAARPRAAEALLRQTMDDLNVEFEFQLRRTLRDWVSAVVPTADGGLAAPGPAGVAREDLPRP